MARTSHHRYGHDIDLALFGVGVALVGAVAWADFVLPGAFAVCMVYAAVPLFGLSARRVRVAVGLALVATVAAGLVPLLSTSGHADMAAVANRAMALVAIWVGAVLIVYVRRHIRQGWRLTTFLDRDDIFQAVFNQTFQFVAALNLDGRIVEANQTLCDYTGLGASEIRGMALCDLPLFEGDEAARVRLHLAVNEAAAGNFVRDEYAVTRHGGKEAIIDLSLKPTRDENQAIRHIIMEARDVTETRTQQRMLVQAQKMEAVGELTAGIAHDFNNLLTVVAGNLELLERRLRGNAPALDRLRRALAASFRGQALTRQLLAFSRRQALHPAVIDVNGLLEGMSDIFASLSDGVSIEFDLADDLPHCEVDPNLLENALLNIAINGRDAMPNGGILLFRTSHAVLNGDLDGDTGYLGAGDYVCVSISDTGVGIPDEVLPQVFDPFFTTKDDGQGSGLGLSMVYGFVKQSGGDVRIQSEVGLGTTIHIYLPAMAVVSADPSWPAETRAPELPCTGKSILLVEDDRAVRDAILDSLQEIGCAVDTADSSNDAMSLLGVGGTYDLVITDMVIPGTYDGAQLGRAIRATDSRLPIIFCSGFPRRSFEGEDPEIEGAFFLLKPFRHDELISVVERAFTWAMYEHKNDRVSQ